MTETVLFNSYSCPFGHRAWLTALQKQIPFKLHVVDLRNKDQVFKDTYAKAYPRNPNKDGLVPTLIHGDNIICESDLVSWFIAENFDSGSELIPKDTFERLKMRRFLNSVPAQLVSAFYGTSKYYEKSEQEQAQVRLRIKEALDRIQAETVGPFVLGQHISLADIMIYPLFEQWVALKKLFNIGIGEQYKKIHRLISAMQQRESVSKVRGIVSEQVYIEALTRYLS